MVGEEKDYRDKRRFEETPEPQPSVSGNVDPTTARPGPTFMVHQHHATRLHFDLRLEMLNGDTPVLVSWAVPKNLPQRKGERHLAVHVEDHPFEYGGFSGTIPAGNYGAGEVRIFDSGTYEVLEQEPAKLTIRLHGSRLKGVWHMIQTGARKSKPAPKKDEWLVFLRENLRGELDPLPPMDPMTATLADEAFDDDRWIFEPKWDGVRALATCTDQTLILSRSLRDITGSYPELSRIHEQLVALEAVVDGEIVTLHEGRPSFERLQSRINLTNERDIKSAMQTCPVTFIAFDLLYLDGRSLLGAPLEERKALLEAAVVPTDRIDVSTYIEGEGRTLYSVAEQSRLEGIVAKKLGSPYRSGRRSKEWLKIKTTHDVDVVIGGWSEGEGSRSSRFGALLVGVFDGATLRFIGAVGTGFSDRMLGDLMAQLRPLQRESSPFDPDPSKDRSKWGKALKNPTWVEPKLAAQVEYRELTSGGKLRAPSFKSLRSDKEAAECTAESLGLDAR